MDLLTSIANKFDIPIVRKDQRVWFFRTRGGKYYYDFTTNGFIALGWDKISPVVIAGNSKTKEGKKKYIKGLYPEEKRPGLILSQMDVFYNHMHNGDLVLIPDEGTKTVSVGLIGDFVEKLVRKSENEDHAQCSYLHRRSVIWKKELDVCQDIYLFKALRAQQTISDITEDATMVFRNLFPVYIAEDLIHLTFQKPTEDSFNLSSNVELLANIMAITDATASLYGKESFRDRLAMRTAVGSPGFFEIILPDLPVAAISASFIVFIVKQFIGKEKGADGSVSTGLLAMASKINELINDHVKRKKDAAEIEQIKVNNKLIEAQVEKAKAETDLIRAQTYKENEEARRISLENEQIAILPSGKTTEEIRIESEQISLPTTAAITDCIKVVGSCGCKICTAASENGLSLGEERIKKTS